MAWVAVPTRSLAVEECAISVPLMPTDCIEVCRDFAATSAPGSFG